MNDILPMRGFEGLGNLHRNTECLVGRKGTLFNAVGERGTLDEFHDECRRTVALFQTIESVRCWDD